MTREAHPSDFTETVDGIGSFTFGKRTLRDVFRIRSEYLRLTEGIEGPEEDFLELFARAVSALKVLIVDAPKGWEPEEIDRMDPFDDEVYGRIYKVWSVLNDKEGTFRHRRAAVPGGGA